VHIDIFRSHVQELCYFFCRSAILYESDNFELAWGEVEAAEVIQERREDFLEVRLDEFNRSLLRRLELALF
jgi:hypothetical protein